MKICQLKGCNNKHKAKGFCDLHYYRFRKNGDPHKVKLNHKPEKGYTGLSILFKKYIKSVLIGSLSPIKIMKDTIGNKRYNVVNY